MKPASTLEFVRKIFVEELGVNHEDVTPDADILQDLGADSLDQVELVMAFEEAFDIEIADEDAERCNTVQKVIDYLKNQGF